MRVSCKDTSVYISITWRLWDRCSAPQWNQYTINPVTLHHPGLSICTCHSLTRQQTVEWKTSLTDTRVETDGWTYSSFMVQLRPLDLWDLSIMSLCWIFSLVRELRHFWGQLIPSFPDSAKIRKAASYSAFVFETLYDTSDLRLSQSHKGSDKKWQNKLRTPYKWKDI